ncbi:MAG: KilA-N domain-containing protein [Coriobacteriia bacterium]|nr:KilA-N domain-containing protein [Coriobacteriia bacterium]
MAKQKQEIISVQGTVVSIVKHNKDDYISLTDMAKHKNPSETSLTIAHWLSTNYTLEFLGLWEKTNNPFFNTTEFRSIKEERFSQSFTISTKQWVERTGAVGIYSKAGRYGGGTFAHRDIAFEFATWISAEFKYYLILEFQRLQKEEQQRLSAEWSLQRTLAKINYLD